MDNKTFLEKLDAIEGMTLDRVEYHDRLIALLIQVVKEREDSSGPAPSTADSVTSSPDSS